MNKLKKIGLTALAASLVTTSAFAAELTATGAASMGVKNNTGTSDTSSGKSFTMGNSVTLAGSGETDGGLTVSLSFELDSGVDTGTGTGPFDSHSLTVGSDTLGTLVMSGHGGSSAQSAMDTTAAGDLYDNGLGITVIAASATGDNGLFYTLPAMVDGVAITASLQPGVAGTETTTAFGLAYTGVEGLTLKYGQGDGGTRALPTDVTSMSASYAIGSFTLSASNTEADKTGAANEEVDSFQLAYTVSDSVSLTYGEETYDTVGSSVDEEVEGYGISYTAGGMTLSANAYEGTGAANVAGAKSERWKLGLAFAF
jgi:outer membrane protein OmpU